MKLVLLCIVDSSVLQAQVYAVQQSSSELSSKEVVRVALGRVLVHRIQSAVNLECSSKNSAGFFLLEPDSTKEAVVGIPA
eukprot:315279-Amphidinium_carterae.2